MNLVWEARIPLVILSVYTKSCSACKNTSSINEYSSFSDASTITWVLRGVAFAVLSNICYSCDPWTWIVMYGPDAELQCSWVQIGKYGFGQAFFWIPPWLCQTQFQTWSALIDLIAPFGKSVATNPSSHEHSSEWFSLLSMRLEYIIYIILCVLWAKMVFVKNRNTFRAIVFAVSHQNQMRELSQWGSGFPLYYWAHTSHLVNRNLLQSRLQNVFTIILTHNLVRIWCKVGDTQI